MSTYLIHMGHNATGYGVHEKIEDLRVWQAADANPSSAAYLVTFLNTHARHLGAHEVRRALCLFGSDLEPLDTPPTAIEGDHDKRAR